MSGGKVGRKKRRRLKRTRRSNVRKKKTRTGNGKTWKAERRQEEDRERTWKRVIYSVFTI
jgi:hypothetical protein